MAKDTIRRSAESRPLRERLTWAPDVPALHADVDGIGIRYVSVGSGRPVVLLHSLRTQLDMFQKVIPSLAQRFRVLAPDLPGHGHSDAPDADYDAEFFVAAVARLLERLDVRDAIVVGESIGATIALVLAARRDPHVGRVVAINPYDYDRGRGLRRSSALANVVLGVAAVPLIGEAFTRLAPYPVLRRILEGGVSRRESFSSGLLRELHAAGKAAGHTRAFVRLVRHWPSWERLRGEYVSIELPVLLLYGEHDWSREDERDADRRSIPGARPRVVAGAGHFLSIEAPEAVVRAVEEITADESTRAGA